MTKTLGCECPRCKDLAEKLSTAEAEIAAELREQLATAKKDSSTSRRSRRSSDIVKPLKPLWADPAGR